MPANGRTGRLALKPGADRDHATRERLCDLADELLRLVGGMQLEVPLAGMIPAGMLLGPFRPKVHEAIRALPHDQLELIREHAANVAK